MPALANPATWRTSPYSAEFFCAVIKPPVVFAARVNQSSFSYPLAEVTFDDATTGAYTDLSAGLLVCFGTSAGASDLGRQRIRKAATSSVLYIGWSSQGARDGEVNLQDNAYITVYDLRQVWARVPRILSDGTIYKDYDLAYTDGIYPPPVANIGPGYAELVDDTTSLITVNFADAGSFATANGATITSREWVFPGGTPSTSSSTNPGNVTFPAGFRYAALTVTDSNGKTHTAYAPVFAATKTGANRPTKCEITEHSRRAEGQRMTIRLHEDLPEADYPDGCLVMVWARERYGSTVGSLAGPSGRQHMVFIGWVDTEQHRIAEAQQGLTKDSTLSLIDVAGRLDKLPGFPQQIACKLSMSKWTDMQISTAPANMARFVHYILNWHSTALELADFVWAGSDYPFTILNSEGTSLYEQADQRCQAIGHRLTCNAWGQLKMKVDPQLLASGDRTSTVIVDLTERDWTDIQYTHTRPPRVHWANGAALLISSALDDGSFKPIPVFCRAPGTAPGQGVGTTSTNYQLVKTKTELYVREGNRYATRANAMQGEFRLTCRGGEAGIDPADMEWVRLTVSAGNRFRRGLSFTNERFLPVEISYRYDHRQGYREASLVLEREASGSPAVDIPVPESNISVGSWEISIPNLESFSIPPIDWGGTITFNPVNEVVIDPRPGKAATRGRFFGAVKNGYVFRLIFPAGVATFEDISPTAEQRTLLGASIQLVADAFNYKKLWLYGANAILFCSDATIDSPKWQVAIVIPATGTWRQIYDFTKNDGGATPINATYTPGIGWTGNISAVINLLNQAVIYILGGVTTTLTYAELRFYGFGAAANTALIRTNAGVLSSNTLLSTTGGTLLYSGSVSFVGWFSWDLRVGYPPGELIVYYLEMRGNGANPWTGENSTEEFISQFVPVSNRKSAYYWLSKRTDSGDQVYFNRTLDNFLTIQRTRVARYSAGFIYSIAVNPHDYKQVYVSAGDTSAPSDAFIYKSVDAGNSFAATSAALNANGGALWWNYSTGVANRRNTSDDNFLWGKGTDGSNDQQIVRGLGALAVTILTGSGEHLETPFGMQANNRDLDFAGYVSRTGKFRVSSDSGATWNVATDVPGGASKVARGWSQFTPDSEFAVAFGYRIIAYTLNSGTTWTDLWATFDAFRSGAGWGTDGETIVTCIPDLSLRYPVAVTS